MIMTDQEIIKGLIARDSHITIFSLLSVVRYSIVS